jgi:hypothetical protein
VHRPAEQLMRAVRSLSRDECGPGFVDPLEHGLKAAQGLAVRTVSLQESITMIPDGAILMIGGFTGVGSPG